MRCVILQPSYVPWRGFFDLVRRSDLFVFLDDVQYDIGWRNRNLIKTPAGTAWLTVPVHTAGFCRPPFRMLNEIPIAYERQDWVRAHLARLEQSYRHAPYFETYIPLVREALERRPALLVDLTIDLTVRLSRALGLATPFARASEVATQGGKTDALIQLLRHFGATSYLSGPAARAYLEPEKFVDAGIALEFIEYDYPEYRQLYPPFRSGVSILDLLFMEGPAAPDFLRPPTRA